MKQKQKQKIPMSQLTGKYVGKPFDACTCMNLAHGWYTDLGIDVPDRFDGLDLDTYFHAWQTDKKSVIKTMEKLFSTLGVPADPDHLKRHDLLVVQEKGNKYAAVYIGNNMIITSHLTEGVKIMHLGRFHQVVMARRLI